MVTLLDTFQKQTGEIELLLVEGELLKFKWLPIYFLKFINKGDMLDYSTVHRSDGLNKLYSMLWTFCTHLGLLTGVSPSADKNSISALRFWWTSKRVIIFKSATSLIQNLKIQNETLYKSLKQTCTFIFVPNINSFCHKVTW